jgi:hypothetical protein
MTHHRFLYPRSAGKEQWTTVGAPTGWQALKKTGLLVPTKPTAEQLGVRIEASAVKDEFLRFDNYVLLPGEKALAATLYCWVGITGGEAGNPLKERLTIASKAVEVTTNVEGEPAWHAAGLAGPLTQENIEEIEAKLISPSKGTSTAVAAYIDLETVTPEELPLKGEGREPSGVGPEPKPTEEDDVWKKLEKVSGPLAWLAFRFLK